MDDNDQSDNPADPPQLPKLYSEAEVQSLWGDIFATRELRRARQKGEISYYDMPKGPRYSEAQLVEYLETKRLRRAENPAERPAGAASVVKAPPPPIAAASVSVTEAERATVARLARNIGKMPKKR